jgi:hypothetical protein
MMTMPYRFAYAALAVAMAFQAHAEAERLQCFIPLAALACGKPDPSHPFQRMECQAPAAPGAKIFCANPHTLPSVAQSLGYGKALCAVDHEKGKPLDAATVRQGWICSLSATQPE